MSNLTDDINAIEISEVKYDKVYHVYINLMLLFIHVSIILY